MLQIKSSLKIAALVVFSSTTLYYTVLAINLLA
jgi:hypothetical protein